MAEGRYTRIKSRFWVDEKVQDWSDDTKLLALYLLTSPHNNMMGCYVLPKLYICEDLGWEPERLAEPFAKLLDDGFIKYDAKARLVLLCNYLKHNQIENGNRAIAAIKLLDEMPKSQLFLELQKIIVNLGIPHLQKLADALENQAPKQLQKPFDQPLGKGNGNHTPTPTHTPTDINNISSPDGSDEYEITPAEKPQEGGAQTQKSGKGDEYTTEFEEFYSNYPRRIEKKAAFKAWQARLKEKILPDSLIVAAKNYAANCLANGTEQRFIKHPSTFLGPSKPYEDWIRPPTNDTPKPNQTRQLTDDEEYMRQLEIEVYGHELPC